MSSLPAHVFREYDIRGLVEGELTPAFARTLGLGLGTLLRRRHPERTAAGQRPLTFVVGRDIRLSSNSLRDGLVEGLCATGVSVVDIGVVATPLTYFAAHALETDGLAMITGSHNPPEFNGFKVGFGRTTFHSHEIQELRRLCEEGRFDLAATPAPVRSQEIIPAYHDTVAARLQLGPRRPRVVVDAGNGCGGFIAVPLLRRLGFEVVEQYIEPDGNFPHHHPDPTVVENLQDLVARVRAEKADVGIAYDGDADRIGAVDEQGNILWGDQLMVLFAREILSEQPGATFVSEVKCSMTMYDEIERLGGKAVMWKAGHSLIKAKMLETGALLAGEMSGHIFFKHRWYGFDDAIYATGRLLEILSNSDTPLSAMLAGLPHTDATPELRSDFPEHLKFRAVELCRQKLSALAPRTVDVDGVRAIWPDGWGLVRASNTQPLLVLRYEATTTPRREEIQRLVEGVLAEVRRELGLS